MLLHYLVKVKNEKCNIKLWDITEEIASNVLYSFIEMDLYIIKFGVLCSNACMKHKFVILQKRLMQTWFDFEHNVINAAIGQWCDCLRVCMLVAETLNTCCEIIVHLYYVVHQNISWNHHTCSSFLNLTVKTALKSVTIWRSYRQN